MRAGGVVEAADLPMVRGSNIEVRYEAHCLIPFGDAPQDLEPMLPDELVMSEKRFHNGLRALLKYHKNK